jgi:NitT/TauT family transport system substrate-binding protein
MNQLIKSVVTGIAIVISSISATHAGAPEKSDISLGVGSIIVNYAPVGLGVALGNFNKEGLNVTVENFQAGGSKALQALIGGSVDAVVGFYDHTIQMQAQGKEIVAVALLNDMPGILLGTRADLAGKVKSVKDLKGLKLGITAPGSSTDIIARYLLTKNGLNPSDVSIIAVGSGAPGMVALEAKTVDALMYFDPVASELARKKTAVPLVDTRSREGSQAAFGGQYPTACLYVMRSFIEKNPETVQRLVNSFARTLNWIQATPPAKIVATLPANWKLGDTELNVEVWTHSKDMFSKTGRFDPEAVKVPMTVLSSFDKRVSPTSIDLSKTYTNKFIDEALKQLK